MEMSAGERLVDALIEQSHLVAPHELSSLVARRGRDIGARETVLYLADLEQVTLVPLPGADVPDRGELTIEATLAGRAFRTVEVLESEAAQGRRIWVPLLDGVERLGVMELVTDEADDAFRRRARRFAGLVAELVVSKRLYTDFFDKVRRQRVMTLPAEIQRALLPPLTFGTRRVVISGNLQPAYEAAGDSFDYALGEDDVARFAVFDAMGHGLEAALLATVAVSGYRSCRRREVALVETAAEIDTAIARQFGAERFVTGLLAELDVATGRLTWVNAGHPAPVVIRAGKIVKTLGCPPGLPLGYEFEPPHPCTEMLEPGDRLLLYTDGVVEARSPAGEFFGIDRLADMVIRHTADGLPAPETLRRLAHAILRHQQTRLADDATTLFVEWLTGDDEQLKI